MQDEPVTLPPAPRTARVKPPTAAERREERLKAALKANMAKRKAQAKAKAGQEPAGQETAGQETVAQGEGAAITPLTGAKGSGSDNDNVILGE